MAKKKKKKTAAAKATAALVGILEDRNEAAAQVTSIDQILAAAGPSLTTSPTLAGPAAGGATGVTEFGPGGIPETGDQRGFLEAFWPLLLALAVGALAFFWLDWSWWASGLAGVAALILARVGAAFMQGAAGEGE